LVFIFLFFIKIYYCLKDYIVKTPSPGSNNINTNPGSSQGPGSGGNPNKEKKITITIIIVFITILAIAIALKEKSVVKHMYSLRDAEAMDQINTYLLGKICKKYKIPAYTYKGKAKNKYSKFFILNNKNKVC
jgi:uncharacterized protein YxeA